MNRIKEITGLDTIDQLLDELQALKEDYNLGSEMLEDIRQTFDYVLELEQDYLLNLNNNRVRKDIRVYNSRNIKRW